MTRMIARTLFVLAAGYTGLAAVPVRVQGPDSLASARELYAAAAYREALAMLDVLRPRAVSSEEAVEVEKYRAFCLVVLGRPSEAEDGIARILSLQPHFRLGEDEVSRRIFTAFEEMRQKVIPQAAQEAYERAEGAYQKQDFEQARDGFSLVLMLAEEAGPEQQRAVKDLATLARGFLVLVAANAPPLPSTAIARNVGFAPALKSIYDADDPGVVPPSVIEQVVPRWPVGLRAVRAAVLELIVDERGGVESATMAVPFDSPYDRMLLEAAKAWRYRPALCGGQPVKFRRVVRLVAGSPPAQSPDADGLHPAAR